MKRVILSAAVLLMLVLPSVAQQLPIFSLYRDNSFVVNPAIAGSSDHAIASVTFRQQWVKVDQAPRTFSANFQMPAHRRTLGVGGQIIHDRTGPTSFTGATVSYAYHLSFAKINPFKWPLWLRKSTFSFGLSASVFQYSLRTSELELDQANDPSIASADQSIIRPNAGIGLYYYFDNFYIGYSSPQIIPFNLGFEGVDGDGSIKRKAHHYTVVGGTIPFYYDKLFLEPMLWFKAVNGAPFQIDGQLRFRYKDQFWVGAGYRTSKTIIIELGVKIQKTFQIGYAFDQGAGDLANPLGTSHEFILSYHFKEKKRW